MPLPIAVGGKSISTELLSGPCCQPENSDDGVPLMPVELYQTIGWGVCPKNEWLVRVTVSYYDLIFPNSGSRDCTMLEVRIQVSPMTRPLSSDYRETIHHLKLIDGARDDYPQFQPQVSVSDDRRNVALLLFHPHQQSSAVVIFQLRKPRSDLNKSKIANIPLPSYCDNSTGSNAADSTSVYSKDAPAVATNPHFASMWGVSAICSIPNISPPMFLAACNDGSLIWLDARSSAAVATGTLNISQDNLPLSALSVTASGMERGYVLAVSAGSGHCILAKWKLESGTALQETKLERNSTGALTIRSIREDLTKSLSVATAATTTSSTTTTNPAEPKKQDVYKSPPKARMAVQEKEKRFRGWRKRFLPRLATLHSPSNQDKNNLGTKEGVSGFDFETEKDVNQQKQQAKERMKKEDAKKRKSHMDDFVLKELQKKAITGSWVTHTTGIVGAGRLPSRMQRRRSHGAEDGMQRSMQIEVLSVLEEEVVAAQFGPIPTIVCVAYAATMKNKQMAKIFSICELGNFQPVLPLVLTEEDVDEAVTFKPRKSRSSHREEKEWDLANSFNTRFGVDYDALSGAFAISAACGKKWIGCVWNWRENAVGLVVKNDVDINALWSRLYFGSHQQTGQHFCYLETTMQGLKIQNTKHLMGAANLSPPNSLSPTLEPQSFLLASDHISFPFLSEASTSGTKELQWKVSTLPLPYVSTYGPPRLACVGRHNRTSFAVASSKGVCVLDSKHRWRQFGTPSEEASFSIVSMVWWERETDSMTKIEEGDEDLLVAIIQSKTGQQYLSCWSPKRLGMRSQLLVSLEEEKSTDVIWGMPLNKEIKATSLSILAEPKSHDSVKQERRAVVFLSSTNFEMSEMNYTSFQLQLTRAKAQGVTGGFGNQKQFSILAKKVIQGTFKDGTRSVGPISSVFVAGASFRFDLESDNEQNEHFVATIGISRTPGGLEVISLDTENRAYISPVVSADEVSKVWLADIVNESGHIASHHWERASCVWAIELINGELFCWSVPCLTGKSTTEGSEFELDSFSKESTISRPKGLRPPTLVCKRKSRSNKRRFLLGILSHVGTSSDWMQQTSSGCQKDIAMGLIPQSSFGCGLRAGQGSKRVRRLAVTDFDGENFTLEELRSEVYCPSDFLMTPPAFVPSLYSMFLEAAHLRSEVLAAKESNVEASLELQNARISTIESHIQARLQGSPNKDSVMMGLRLLIIRSVEMLASVDKKNSKEQSDASHSSLLLAKALFSEVVEAVRTSTTDLQFASLFLEVGRQVEPSCLEQLFPLPQSIALQSDEPNLSRKSAKTVFDLFSLCVQEGSLVASASALPLLTSRVQSRNYCDLLMARSIGAFIENASASNSKFDQTEEERRVIGDIFRFGIKLEDAAKFEDQMKASSAKMKEEKKLNLEPQEFDDSFSYDSEEASGKNLICNLDVFSRFSGSNEEEAIRRSAISFIGNNADFQSLDFLNIVDEGKRTEKRKTTVDEDLKTMGGLVGGVIVDLIRSPKTDRPWKTMACLARMLLQERSEINVDIFSKVAEEVEADDMETLLPTTYSGEDEEKFTQFMLYETGKCQAECSEMDANIIVDLILFVLNRLEGFRLPKSQAFIPTGLVFIGLVAGSIAGRDFLLLSTLREDCFINDCLMASYDA